MLIIAYSRVSDSNIKERLGSPEYSYYFVLREFLPVLERLGTVIIVSSYDEVDPLYEEAKRNGQKCVLLSFTAPHNVPLNLACPTIPVFAWEYDTIPNENWDELVSDDWSAVLRALGCAITHSEFAVKAIRAAVGEDFPVASITVPVWDRLAHLREGAAEKSLTSTGATLTLDGEVVDSRAHDLSRFAPRAVSMSREERARHMEGRMSLFARLEYAESIVRERDAQLAKRNADCAYAEGIVRERDAQLAKRNRDFAHAESVVRERDAQLTALRQQLGLVDRASLTLSGGSKRIAARLARVAISPARRAVSLGRRLLGR